MEETNNVEVKEEVKENTNEMKKVRKAKLGPAATVILTIAATLGIIVLITVVYFLFQAL